MDLAPPEELQFLTISQILSESIKIPKSSPRTFSLITLTLIFPLSFAILAHSLFTHPLIQQISYHSHSPSSSSHHQLFLIFLYQFLYLISLFAFSLLSTAAVVFTVASLYTSKPVSFSSTLSAIPSVFKRIFVTYLYISLLLIGYNFVFVLCLVFLFLAESVVIIFLSIILLLLMFLVVHVYITALWHLASVVSVLEPVYGLDAIKKSRELLKGKTRMIGAMVLWYLSLCGFISSVFGAVVVMGGEVGYGTMTRVVVGAVLIGVLVVVNLIGLLAQSVVYYVCKSHHREWIDRSALHEHLGGYLGEYVPLKSSIQMETLDA